MARTAMIVDDVAFVRQTLGQILVQAGFQIVAEAADGAQALQLYAKHRPDLVTMDIVMPAMSGIEATRKIVKLDKQASILIVSAMGQENLVMEAINAGARDYLVKPFRVEDIIKTVNRLIEPEDPSKIKTTQAKGL